MRPLGSMLRDQCQPFICSRQQKRNSEICCFTTRLPEQKWVRKESLDSMRREITCVHIHSFLSLSSKTPWIIFAKGWLSSAPLVSRVNESGEAVVLGPAAPGGWPPSHGLLLRRPRARLSLPHRWPGQDAERPRSSLCRLSARPPQTGLTLGTPSLRQCGQAGRRRAGLPCGSASRTWSTRG